MRIAAVLGLVASCAVLSLLAGPVAASNRSCGSIYAQGTRFAVTVTQGHVKCTTARHVLSDFLHGKGKMHGPSGGPAYLQWWGVDGWKCGYGTGGGGCSRGHKRILAQQS